ncbi:hypothetical protein LSH36_83g06044 [Paralvinella palmiformis]|uniref:Uncharacterized protein n=1 Tax=Paralvinella palmiformis TaxID=53620 RepID=A0AAD9K1R6_9ANNE|nr:hypothetical protein LSH36_83g06044 [Paralvinella palmiformis]
MLTGTYLTINRTDDDGIGTGHAIIPNMAVRPTMLPLTAKYVPQYGSHGQAAAHQHALTASSSSSSYGSPLTTGSNVTASFFASPRPAYTGSDSHIEGGDDRREGGGLGRLCRIDFSYVDGRSARCSSIRRAGDRAAAGLT